MDVESADWATAGAESTIIASNTAALCRILVTRIKRMMAGVGKA
jgi:hypothetical protein